MSTHDQEIIEKELETERSMSRRQELLKRLWRLKERESSTDAPVSLDIPTRGLESEQSAALAAGSLA